MLTKSKFKQVYKFAHCKLIAYAVKEPIAHAIYANEQRQITLFRLKNHCRAFLFIQSHHYTLGLVNKEIKNENIYKAQQSNSHKTKREFCRKWRITRKLVKLDAHIVTEQNFCFELPHHIIAFFNSMAIKRSTLRLSILSLRFVSDYNLFVQQ